MVSDLVLRTHDNNQLNVVYSNVEKLDKIKVLFVIDTLQFGGAEQSLLVNTMNFQNITPVVCHLFEGAALKEKFEEKGIKVLSLDIKNQYGFVSAWKMLSQIVKDEKPDLMVAYLTRSEIVARLVGRFHHIPVIGTFVSDLYSKTYNQHLSWKARQLVCLLKWVNRFTSQFCAGFIANSKAVKSACSKHLAIPQQKVEVICRGRESFKFRTRRFEQHKPDDSIRFLNIGRLYPIKGQKELIIAFKDFLKLYPNATLSIIGDGPMKNELLELIDRHQLQDKVLLLGTRNDIPEIIADYDCFVFPSFSEGFSGAIVEAMFAGLPILASDIPQNKEAISHLQNGYLFPKESVHEITKAMEWFKNNAATATMFAKCAYDYAKEHFELMNTVEQFESYLFTKVNGSK